MATTEPNRAVAMIAQFVVRIGMHEHVEHFVVERKPTYDIGKISGAKCNLSSNADAATSLS
jgi:hypothetical protein